MHCCKCAILLTNTNHLLRNLDSVRILSVKTGDERVGVACLNHHHTEVVALVHLVVCLLEGVALTCTASSRDAWRMWHGVPAPDRHACLRCQCPQDLAQTLGKSLQTVGVAEKYWMADALKACLNGSLHHRRVTALGEHYALRMQTGCVVEVACELCLLTQQLHKILLVGVPVGDGFACYSTLNCSLGNSRTHLCDKTRVDGFRDKVFPDRT